MTRVRETVKRVSGSVSRLFNRKKSASVQLTHLEKTSLIQRMTKTIRRFNFFNSPKTKIFLYLHIGAVQALIHSGLSRSLTPYVIQPFFAASVAWFGVYALGMSAYLTKYLIYGRRHPELFEEAHINAKRQRAFDKYKGNTLTAVFLGYESLIRKCEEKTSKNIITREISRLQNLDYNNELTRQDLDEAGNKFGLERQEVKKLLELEWFLQKVSFDRAMENLEYLERHPFLTPK